MGRDGNDSSQSLVLTAEETARDTGRLRGLLIYRLRGGRTREAGKIRFAVKPPTRSRSSRRTQPPQPARAVTRTGEIRARVGVEGATRRHAPAPGRAPRRTLPEVVRIGTGNPPGAAVALQQLAPRNPQLPVVLCSRVSASRPEEGARRGRDAGKPQPGSTRQSRSLAASPLSPRLTGAPRPEGRSLPTLCTGIVPSRQLGGRGGSRGTVDLLQVAFFQTARRDTAREARGFVAATGPGAR